MLARHTAPAADALFQDFVTGLQHPQHLLGVTTADATTLNNKAGATYTFTGDGGVFSGSLGGTFINAGTLQKNASATGTSTIFSSVAFDNQGGAITVNAGDLIAMQLTNRSTGDVWFAFTKANSDGQGHLVNYGNNTWGFEDTRGGGDHDFNDLVIQLDFTSSSGHQWLM